MLGTTFLKSFNVASSYCDKTHFKSFSLYWILKDVIMPWSKGLTMLVTLGGRNTKVMLLNSKVETMRLTNFGIANNMWRYILQNHDHLWFWPLNWLLSCKIQASNISPFIQVVLIECHRIYLWGCCLPKHRSCLDIYITWNFNLSIPIALTTKENVTRVFYSFQPPFTFPCANIYWDVL